MRLRDCDGEIDYACSVIDVDQSLDGVSTVRQVVNTVFTRQGLIKGPASQCDYSLVWLAMIHMICQE